MYQRSFRIIAAACVTCLVGSLTATAAPKDYNFKDPKGVNSMSFVLDSLLEPIMGLATDISGTITYDPDKPEATKGKLVVQSKSLHIHNKRMEEVLHGNDWINVESYPEVTFEFKKVDNIKRTTGGAVEMDVTGDFSLKGVTKTITIPVRITHLPGRMSDRMRGAKGDLLVVRANFTIDRTEYGIKEGMGDETVAHDIEIRASIVGMAPNK
jgi:polyisoprenoid-binding protein YceI